MSNCWYTKINLVRLKLPQLKKGIIFIYLNQDYPFPLIIKDSPNDVINSPEYITCPFLIGIGETLQPEHVLTNTHVATVIKIKTTNNASPCKPLNRRGKDIRLVMSLYNDRTFTKYYDLNSQEQPSASFKYADVFYKIHHLSGHDNFKMVPMTCYATPDPNPENPIRYKYITNR